MLALLNNATAVPVRAMNHASCSPTTVGITIWKAIGDKSFRLIFFQKLWAQLLCIEKKILIKALQWNCNTSLSLLPTVQPNFVFSPSTLSATPFSVRGLMAISKVVAVLKDISRICFKWLWALPYESRSRQEFWSELFNEALGPNALPSIKLRMIWPTVKR